MSAANPLRRLPRHINRFLGWNKASHLYNVRAELERYFKKLGIGYEEAESALRSATGGNCLYFKSDKGQQLEALIFSAISLTMPNTKNVLEIGTGSGTTTVILSGIFPDARIYTFDLPDDDRDYSSLSYRKEDTEFDNRVNRPNVQFYARNSFYLLSHELPMFDVVFIDGGHSYPAVAWDAMYAYNRTKSQGFIVFHDYNRPNNDPRRNSNDVKDLIDNYLREIIEEEIECLPWAAYDPGARTCIIRKR